jgi:hypothetical protein
MWHEPIANETADDELHFEAVESVNHGFWEYTGAGWGLFGGK